MLSVSGGGGRYFTALGYGVLMMLVWPCACSAMSHDMATSSVMIVRFIISSMGLEGTYSEHNVNQRVDVSDIDTAIVVDVGTRLILLSAR